MERRARGRGGRPFWGCSKYPNCDLLLNQPPLPTPCPECGSLMVQKGRNNSACTSCSWQETVGDAAQELEAVGA